MAASTPRGLNHPTSDDKIKDGSSPSALADDFAALASSADAAITAGVQEAKDAASADASAKDAAIDAKATSAVSTANNALAVSSGASADADNAVDRVTALESAAGFGPSTPTDGTMANFIANPESLTAGALSAAIGYIGGLVDDGATDNAAAIQAALNLGGRWMLPPTAGSYAVGSTLNVNVPGTELHAVSAPMKSLHTLPVFQVNAADVLLDIPDVTGAVGAPNFTGMTGTFEGSSRDSGWCAVNVAPTAHRLSIPRMFGRGFSAVVRLGGWDTNTGTYATYQTEDVRLGDIGCDYVEFGVALRGTRRMVIDRIHGRYGNTVGGGRPPHLIYFANGGAKHSQAVVGSGVATGGAGNSIDGQAFQFKDFDDSTVGPLIADGCFGVANIMDCEDTEFHSIKSVNDQYMGLNGSLMVDAVSLTNGIKFGTVDIDMGVNNQSVSLINGDDCEFDSIRVRVAHTTTASSTVGDIDIRGQRNKLGKVKVTNTGASNSWPALVLWSGAGHRVDDVEATNVRVGVNTRSTDATVTLDRSKITLHPTDGIFKTGGSDNAQTASAKWYFPDSLYLSGHPRLLAADDFRTTFGSFNGAGGTLTGQVWKWGGTSTWVVDGAGAVREQNGGTDKHAWIATGVPDVEVECNVLWQKGEGIVIRRVDDTNHLIVIPASTALILRKVEAGVSTTLATVALSHVAGRKYHLRVRAQGDSIRVWEDGVSTLTHTLSAGEQTLFGANGNHGLRSNGNTGKFDTFRILRT